MFKLESYVTPYILAYLGKYFKNFDPADFQVSLWSGAAVFNNLNLNLEVLDEEFNLPVSFKSGHIHELRISVPWTKVTSEPIQVHINTIEVSLKLKSLDGDDETSSSAPPSASSSSTSQRCDSGRSSTDPYATPETPPTSYMQGIINKILQNVHVTFENVIVKYVEEDVVLSLNIKQANYCTADDEWAPSFIELSPPEFFLRKKFQFQDLTVCLDRRELDGFVSLYQEPFLYRCAFEIRIMQKFKSALSKIAFFTRMDFHFNEMIFSVTDEQVPMVMRLYNLVQTLFRVDLTDVPVKYSKSRPTFQNQFANSTIVDICDPEQGDEELPSENGSWLDWGVWAVNWLPPISSIFGEEHEGSDGYCDDQTQNTAESLSNADRSNLLCHYGFYADRITVTFKALERVADSNSRFTKVRFLPFLKLQMQGLAADFVFRGDECNHLLGVSMMDLVPMGFCPCGIIDGKPPCPLSCSCAFGHYLQIGRNNNYYTRNSMFDPIYFNELPPFDYDFQYVGRMEKYSEADMMNRSPAISVEFLQCHAPQSLEDFDDFIDLGGKEKVLCRMLISPCILSLSSGLIHRLKLISYAVDTYAYEPYGEINRLMSHRKSAAAASAASHQTLRTLPLRIESTLDLNLYGKGEGAEDIYQLSIQQPQIHLIAADHPEYDFESRDKHLGQKRRIRTTTPFTQVLPAWPKLVFSANSIEMVSREPNLRFRALVAKTAMGNNSSNPPHLPVDLHRNFKRKTEIKANCLAVHLLSGEKSSEIISPMNVSASWSSAPRLDIFFEDSISISEFNISTDLCIAKATWLELNLVHLIIVSMLQNVERFSEHLTTSTLLEDYPKDYGNRMKLVISKASYESVTTWNFFSSRFIVSKLGAHLQGNNIKDCIPIFSGPILSNGVEDPSFAMLIFQYPIDPPELPKQQVPKSKKDKPRSRSLIRGVHDALSDTTLVANPSHPTPGHIQRISPEPKRLSKHQAQPRSLIGPPGIPQSIVDYYQQQRITSGATEREGSNDDPFPFTTAAVQGALRVRDDPPVPTPSSSRAINQPQSPQPPPIEENTELVPQQVRRDSPHPGQIWRYPPKLPVDDNKHNSARRDTPHPGEIERIPPVLPPPTSKTKEPETKGPTRLSPYLPLKREESSLQIESNSPSIQQLSVISSSLNPVFIIRIYSYRACYHHELLEWASYVPAQIPCLIPQSVRMGREIKVPLRPLSRSSSKMESGSITSDLNSVSFQSCGSVSSTAIGSKGQEHESNESRSSSRGGSVKSSLPGYQLPYTVKEKSLEGDIESVVRRWEAGLLSHLSILRKAYLDVNVQTGEVVFLIKSSRIVGNRAGENEAFLVTLPKVLSKAPPTPVELSGSVASSPTAKEAVARAEKNRHVRELHKELEHYQQLPLPFQLEVPDKKAPLSLWLHQFSFATVKNSITTRCCEKTTIRLNLSITSKKIPNAKKPVTTAFIHSDIPEFKIFFTYDQIMSICNLLETLLRGASCMEDICGLLQPPSPDELPSSSSSTNGAAKTEETVFITPSGSRIGLRPPTNVDLDDASSLPTTTTSLLEQLHEETQNINTNAGTSSGAVSAFHEIQATLWTQFTVGKFEFCMFSQNRISHVLPLEKIVLELEELVSSLDIQSIFVKWTHKVGRLRLRNYERDPINPSNWVLGKSLGIILSTVGGDVTKDVAAHAGSFTKERGHTGGNYTPRISHPDISTASAAASSSSSASSARLNKRRDVLMLNFTRVECSNYYLKSGISSPFSKWASAIVKYIGDKEEMEKYAPLPTTSSRCLNEVDIKIPAIDIVLNPAVYKPYSKIVDRFLQVFTTTYSKVTKCEEEKEKVSTTGCAIPMLNNNSLPILYMEVDSVRIFLKGETEIKRTGLKGTAPNFFLLECSYITIASHNENPLNRTLVSPFLHQLGEKARILQIPGSPVEDRQYRVEIKGILLSSGNWDDVERRTRKQEIRSSLVLITQGENPALEWNIRTVDHIGEDVSTFPILEKMDIILSLAPAIVYERDALNSCKNYLVAGHALEANFLTDVKISLNVDQLDAISQLVTQTLELFQECCPQTPQAENEVEEPNELLHEEDEEPCVNCASDSSLTSLHVETLWEEYRQRKRSPRSRNNVVSEPEPWHRHTRSDVIPLDFLLTSGCFMLTFYDLKYSLVRDVEKVKPLLVGMIVQPHVILHLSPLNQRFEISMFEIWLKIASKEMEKQWIPDIEDFDEFIFECLPGDRDGKTGAVQPMLSFRIMEFITRPASIYIEQRRALKGELSASKLDTILDTLRYILDVGGSPLVPKKGGPKLKSQSLIAEERREELQRLRMLLAKVGSFYLHSNQLLLHLIEEPATIICTVGELSVSAAFERTRGTEKPKIEKIKGHYTIKGIGLSSVFKERSSLILSPFNVFGEGKCVWIQHVDYPLMITTVSIDPLSFFVGPQNILCFQQLHTVFKDYFDELSIVEEEILDLMEQDDSEGEEVLVCDSYEDDLRAGCFKFVVANSASQLPATYQILFSETDRTMSWKYPHHRVLTSIEASPVPLDYESRPPEPTKLDCIVEYFDEALTQFRFYGSFTLSETKGASLSGSILKDKLHLYNSEIWRIRIITPLEQYDRYELVRAEILAACLKVDSIHNPNLIPKLKAHLVLPRITFNFMNNFYYCGKGPNSTLPFYTNDCLNQHDQSFASLVLEANTLLLSVWHKHCTLELASYIDVSILDYEFLTFNRVLEPSCLKASVSLYESPMSNELNSELELSWDKLQLQLGASVIHTLCSSAASWVQLLAAWDGKRIRYNESLVQGLDSVNVNQLIVHNTLPSALKFLQSGGSADNSLILQSRSAAPYYWTTNKSKPICKLGLKNKDWVYSASFEPRKPGYSARTINKKSILIHSAPFSGIQRLITISGPFLVGNALSKEVEVAFLPSNSSSELHWSVPSRDYGLSQLLSLAELDHIRFRLKGQPWSSVIAPTDFKSSSNSRLPISLFEERDGSLESVCVWCSLVEEVEEGVNRCLIVLSPYFLVQSLLPGQLVLSISTSQKSESSNYTLQGRAEKVELEFLHSPQATHHLTVAHQSNFNVGSPFGTISSPSIPLLPEGPLVKLPEVKTSIDEILSAISGLPFGNQLLRRKDLKEKDEESWPFISDLGGICDWNVCVEQPQTQLEVEFIPWIDGLPSILLRFRPWALFVNLSGTEIYYTQCPTGEAEQDEPLTVEDFQSKSELDESGKSWTRYMIPHQAVFSPAQMPLQTGRLRIGLNLNHELVMSQTLRISEEKRRTDVHHVNSDGVIPIDSYSRLDIVTETQIGYITLETRLKGLLLVITLRPTFSILNKSPETLYVQAATLSSNKQQTRGNWNEGKLANYHALSPHNNNESELCCAMPLLRFITDGEPYAVHNNSVKYLALSCGGPWWFVKLMDFSVVFDNMNSQAGVLAAAVSVNVPKQQANYKCSNTLILEEVEFESITLPIFVSWTCSNGQVFISLTPDPAPQLVLHNTTEVPLIYVQSSPSDSNEALMETDLFEQYLILPQNCKAYYTFSRRISGLLDGQRNKIKNFLLLTKLPQDLKDYMTSTSSPSSSPCMSISSMSTSTNSTYSSSWLERKPHGTLLIPGIDIKWSKVLDVEGDSSQYFSAGEFTDAKILIEKLGFCYYIFIENMSSAEVAATDVRRRIGAPNSAPQAPPLSKSKEWIELKQIASKKRRPSLNKNLEAEDEPLPPFEMHLVIPHFNLVLTDDVTCPTKHIELICLTMEDIYMDQVPIFYPQTYRALFDRTRGRFLPRNSYTISINIGDVQLDSQGFPPGHPCDFPVILKQEQEYVCVIKTDGENIPWKHRRKLRERQMSADSTTPMISLTVEYGQSSLTYKSIESVRLNTNPLILNVEDRLLDSILPAIQSIYEVADDHLVSIRKVKVVCCSKKEEESLPESESSSSSTLKLHRANTKTAISMKSTTEQSPSPPVLSTESVPELSSVPGVWSDVKFPISENFTEEVAESLAQILSPTTARKSVRIMEPEKSETLITKITSDVLPLSLSPMKIPASSTNVSSIPSNSIVRFAESLTIISSSSSSSSSPHHLLGIGGSFNINKTQIPKEMLILLSNFSNPVLFDSFVISNLDICLTLRMAKHIYVALDHSRIKIPEFKLVSAVTTSYHLGQALSAHYTTGAIFQIGNPMRMIGSLELLGSPGTLFECVGTGLKDFVVYPYQGIFQGPTGFVAGLGSGVTSLVKNLTSGALTSVTNWAWSVSRNIDKLTLDEEEQILTEAARRVQLEGFTDGLFQGLTGFGIRLLGAIGGLAHHPIHNVMVHGPTASSLLQGLGRGVMGIVTRPIGGFVELVALTGQGVLRSAGWTPTLKTKAGEAHVEEICNARNSLLKFQMCLNLQGSNDGKVSERLLLLVDASQQSGNNSNPRTMKPVSLLLSNMNMYIVDVGEDMIVSHYPVSLISLEGKAEDGNLICIKTSHPQKNDFANQRMMEFVNTAAATRPPSISFVSGTREVLSVPSDVVPFTPIEISRVSLRQVPTSPPEDIFRDALTSSPTSTQMFTAPSGCSNLSVDSNASSLLSPIFIARSAAAAAAATEQQRGQTIGHFLLDQHHKTELENFLTVLKRNEDPSNFFTFHF